MRIPTRKSDRPTADFPPLATEAEIDARHVLQMALERRAAAQDRLTACDRLVAEAKRKLEESK